MTCPRSCRKSLGAPRTSKPASVNHDFNNFVPALAWLRLGPCVEGKSRKPQKSTKHQTPCSHSLMRNSASNSSFSLLFWPFVFPQLSLKTLKSLSQCVYMDNEWTFRVTKPFCLLPLGFFFVFLLLVLEGRQGRDLRGRQPRVWARLSNGFADMDSRNCCLVLLFQEQPIRQQVLKV